jgi:hypothetical protein
MRTEAPLLLAGGVRRGVNSGMQACMPGRSRAAQLLQCSRQVGAVLLHG